MKRFLRAVNGRLWPLAFLLVLFQILIASDNHNIHTLPLAKTIFGSLHGNSADNFLSSLTEWTGWLIFIIICLLVLRLIIGGIVSDSKAFQRLQAWLEQRQQTGKSNLEITKPFTHLTANVYKSDNLLNKRVSSSHKDALSYPLRYFTFVPAKTAHGRARRVRVEVIYQETAVNEAWRVRDIRETVGRHVALAPTPVVLLFSRLQSARDTALLERLGDPEQFLRLEGSFSDMFDVYVPRGSEIEALDLLTPDVMEMLERTAADTDIKFDNGYVTFFKNGYVFDPAELTRFENQIASTIAGFDRFLQKQAGVVKRKGWQAMFNPARLKPVSLLTDRLLGWGLALFLLTALGNMVLGWFVKSRQLTLGEDVYTILPHAADAGVLCMYAVLTLLFVTFVLGELEVALHRLRLFFVTRRARAAYRRRTAQV